MKIAILLNLLIVFSLYSCNYENPKESAIEYLKSPSSENSMQPFLFSDGHKVLMSWTQKINDSIHTLNYSTFRDGKWSPSKELSKGNNWFVNWADFPVIAQNSKSMISHFLQKSDPATFSYNIQIKQSMNQGEHWRADYKLHKDSTHTEHGFVSIVPYKQDSFFVTWLDGRNTKGGGHNGDHHSDGVMNIRTATVLINGEIIDDILVDSKTCDCCQTSAAITQNGPIIVYRDRSDDEVRDIYISRLIANKWTIPKSIHHDNWKIKGCPVNGPKADSFDNTLAVAWFTAANNIPKVHLAFSEDNGENFNIPIQIDNGKPIGRVDVALIDDKNALVSWMETTVHGAEIKIMKVNINGSKSAPFVISAISASRASGFPQFELINDKIIVAWNHIVDNQTIIKTVRFRIDILN